MESTVKICRVVRQDKITLKQVGQNDVLEFVVAWDRGYGKNKEPRYATVSFWGKRAAGIHPYINAGKQVALKGEYDFPKVQDGNGYWINFKAEDIELLGDGNNNKQDSDQQPQQQYQQPQQQYQQRYGVPSQQTQQGFTTEISDDDLPF